MWVLAAARVLFIVLHTVIWGGAIYFLSFFDPHAERAAGLLRFWAKGNLWACRVRVRVSGGDRLETGRAYIFMSNHQSQFDILALCVALKDVPLRWVAKEELRRVPVLGPCLYRTHQILVDRGSRGQAVATLRKVKELLALGISVIFFPEGTRGTQGNLLPFRPGGFMAAVEAGIPVVPVAIKGSWRVLPTGEWKVSPGQIDVVIGTPIDVRAQVSRKESRRDLLRQVHAAIAAELAMGKGDCSSIG